MPVGIGRGRRGAREQHVVEGRDQDAAVERVEVQIALELRLLDARATRCRRAAASGEKRYSTRAPSCCTCHGSACAAITCSMPCAQAVADRDRVREAPSVVAPRSAPPASRPATARCRPACRRRRRCPRGRRCGSPRIRVGHVRRHAERARRARRPRSPCRCVSMSGSRPHAAGRAARARPRTCASRRGSAASRPRASAGAARRGSRPSGRMIPMFVIAGSAITHATSPGASASRSASRSLNSIARVVSATSTGGPTLPSRATVAPSAPRTANVSSTDAVVAVGEADDLVAAGQRGARSAARCGWRRSRSA